MEIPWRTAALAALVLCVANVASSQCPRGSSAGQAASAGAATGIPGKANCQAPGSAATDDSDTSADDGSDAAGTAAAPAAPTAPTSPGTAATPADTTPKAPENNDRIFGLLPNYLTVENSKHLPPLTSGQKYSLAAQGLFDKVELPFLGVLAGINQAEDENPSWGQGIKGFGRRYAEQFANTGVEDVMVGGAFPAVFKQDPRYFQIGRGNADYMHRFAYAADRIVVTRDDNGGSSFNISEVGGSLSAAGLSNLYEPRGSRTIGNTASVWGTQVLIDTMSNEMREFWPDMRLGLHHLGL